MSAVLDHRQSFPPPPLENGDRLNRKEFRRRWEAMPEVTRAELVEGIVFMAAAVRHRQHGGPQRLLIGWIDRYINHTPGIDGGGNSSVALDDSNEPQPDAYILLPSEVGGCCRVDDDGYLEGPPDFVAEVSASTTSLDMNLKFEVYQRNVVKEYLVWRVLEDAIDLFVLEQNQYVRQPPEPEGILKSRVCPGLWLDTAALLKRNARRLHEVLEQGLASSEHKAFAAEVVKYARQENQ
jgi:Uma2 family endonuclease